MYLGYNMYLVHNSFMILGVINLTCIINLGVFLYLYKTHPPWKPAVCCWG